MPEDDLILAYLDNVDQAWFGQLRAATTSAACTTSTRSTTPAVYRQIHIWLARGEVAAGQRPSR